MTSRLRAEFESSELSEVLGQYDIGPIHSISQQTRGSRHSPKVSVLTDTGRYLLKRRATGRDHPLKVAFAHAVQLHLAKEQFPLPKLIPVQSGDDTMVIINERIYELFEHVEGQAYDRSEGSTRDSGRTLGRFHEILSDYHSDWEPSRRGYHDAGAVRNSLNEIPSTVGKDDSVIGKETELLSTVSSLYDAYESAAERVAEAGFATWGHEIVHSDWHPGNMLFEGGRVRAVLDYDSLHMLPRVTDLANGLLQFSIIGGTADPRLWPAELDAVRFRAFAEGYGEIREVPAEHLRAISSLMIEALIAEAVRPIAATGSFGRIEGFRFLQMIHRKVRWLQQNATHLATACGARK